MPPLVFAAHFRQLSQKRVILLGRFAGKMRKEGFVSSRSQKQKRRRGHVFIEILFAIFLLGLAATILAATMPVANRARATADLNNKAVSMAQKQLEAIRGLGYANATPEQLFSNGLIDTTTPSATNTYPFTNSDSTSLDNPSRILPSGTGTVKVEQVDLDLRRVTITVKYVMRGSNRTFTIGTLIANL